MKLDTLNPAIYRRAAVWVFDHEHCCCGTILRMCRELEDCASSHEVAFGEFFRPPGQSYANAWWSNREPFDVESRVIALLLMAEFVLDAEREARASRGKARRA